MLAFVQRDRVMTARAGDEGWTVSEWRETTEAESRLAWPVLTADGAPPSSGVSRFATGSR